MNSSLIQEKPLPSKLSVNNFNNSKVAQPCCPTTGLVVIDPKVDDHKMLMAGVKPGLEVVLLDENCDGIAQITAVLQRYRNLSSLHIVAHGEAGKLWLGKEVVDSNILKQYKQDLQFWAAAFAPDASILLYGCNVAAGEKGEQFVQQLSQFTGANVAASRNLIGSAALGGSWELELKIGSVEALAFEVETIEAYQAVLTTTRVSVASDGTQANPNLDNLARTISISADGRYVAFDSSSDNLVSGDTNRERDIFVHDTVTSTTRRVSVGIGGTQANGRSSEPSISANGRYVAFSSAANNLVSGDTNFNSDIFVYDTVANTTRRVSVGTGGTQGNSFSFVSPPSISADGRYVAFSSSATNLVSGDTNGYEDIFVYDTVANSTRRVSVSSNGTQSNTHSYDPSISANGRYIAYSSPANNLVSGDTNNEYDIFLYDTVANTTRRVSVSSNGTQGNASSLDPSISADGRYVAFSSSSRNLVNTRTFGREVFVHDTLTNTTRLVSIATDGTPGAGDSGSPSISADGRYVAFSSGSNSLVSGDTNIRSDVFVYDTVANTTRRISVASDGTQGNDFSGYSSISADGSRVAFGSIANNLVSGDTNRQYDVFLYENNFQTQNPWFGTLDNDTYTYTGTAGLTGYGLQGDDVIAGGNGDDVLFGCGGSDRLLGINGDDYLVGGSGNDSLNGGAGNDVLDGSGFWEDLDILTGGAGADYFILGGDRVYCRGAGYTTITDFSSAQGDVIQLFGDSSQYQLFQENLVGSGALDISIYYVGRGFSADLIGVVQDTVNVSLERDFVFV